MALGDKCIYKINVYIHNMLYKLIQYLMIRDYYLRGPTVTDLFVITCNNMVMNTFELMHVPCRRPLKFYIN